MNKFIPVVAATFAALVTCCQPNFAQSANLSVGKYQTFCGQQGLAVSDTRNVLVNLSRQQVIHLQAQNGNQAAAFMHDANNSTFFSVPLTGSVQFSVASGNPNRLEVTAFYTPPGSTYATAGMWVTPTSQHVNSGANVLLNSGNVYSIPIGAGGIPAGSTLNAVFFQNFGNPNNCNNTNCNIYQIGVNGVPVGIDTTDAASCGTPCVL